MANFTSIATGAAANAATVNGPLGQLDTAIGTLGSLTTTDKTSLVAAMNELRAAALGAGASITAIQLIAWAEGEAYEMTAITYNTDLIPTTATLKWPDASAGTYTATTINTTFGTVDAYTLTHTASGYTVTQAAVTRDNDGNVTVKPQLAIT